MFLLKKLIAPFLLPLPLVLACLVAGFILLCRGRKPRMAKLLLAAAILLLLVVGYAPTANRLLAPLESRYPPFDAVIRQNPALIGPGSPIRYVVVLGGGHTSDPNIPVTSRINQAALARLVEGIRIQRLIPASTLVLSGGRVFDPEPEARTMADLALALGVDRKRILLESASRDTREQADFLLPVLGRTPFVLVTSAAHMARSVTLFRDQGMTPVPAPTNHLIKKRQGMSPAAFFPAADNISKTEHALHEYLGLWWAELVKKNGF